MKKIKYYNILFPIFIICTIVIITQSFIIAYLDTTKDVTSLTHKKIAWEIAKVVRYGESSDIDNLLSAFKTKELTTIPFQSIILSMTITKEPKFTPQFKIKDSLNLDSKLYNYLEKIEHHYTFSVFIKRNLWLNVTESINYKYFFLTRAAELGFSILISALLLIACLLFYRIYKITRYARQISQELGIPDNPALYNNIVTGPKNVFIKLVQRIQDLTYTRTQMLSSISHDIRTPLTRLRLRLEELEDANNDMILKAIKDIDEINDMVGGFIKTAKIAKQGHALVDINSIIFTIQDNFADMGINIEYTDNEKPVYLLGSIKIYTRILNNLINNSIKYANNIKIIMDVTKFTVTISIIDDGIGIPEKDLGKVSRYFYQSTNKEPNHKLPEGHGLGLAIVYELVNITDGIILFENLKPAGLKVSMLWKLIDTQKNKEQ